MSEAGRTERCPEEALAAIPWYPDNLSDAQRSALEVHAAVCADCREEMAMVQGHPTPLRDAPDPEPVFARVLELIGNDELQNPGASSPKRTAGERSRTTPARRRRSRWREGQRAAMVAGIALGIALGGGTGVLLAGRGRPAPADYETAATPSEVALGAPAKGATLDVLFRDDATAGAITQALRGLDARIVSGPTPLGRYRVELGPSAVASEAAEWLRAEGTGVAAFRRASASLGTVGRRPV